MSIEKNEITYTWEYEGKPQTGTITFGDTVHWHDTFHMPAPWRSTATGSSSGRSATTARGPTPGRATSSTPCRARSSSSSWASDAAPDDGFGYSVDVSGARVIIGAPDDDDLGEASGAAYVFDADTGQQTY